MSPRWHRPFIYRKALEVVARAELAGLTTSHWFLWLRPGAKPWVVASRGSLRVDFITGMRA